MAIDRDGLANSFRWDPMDAPEIETTHRRLRTSLPAPAAIEKLRKAADLFPEVNCYQAPVVWDRAEGYQVFDASGNCWIDFSSTAVMTNTGHGHPRVRDAIRKHAENELLAQFSFHSTLRSELAEQLLRLAPASMEKVFFWTTGSEAIEAAFRAARQWGQARQPGRIRVASLEQDYHGCTLAAHQLSGVGAEKEWLPDPDGQIHRLPFVAAGDHGSLDTEQRWDNFVVDAAARAGLEGRETAAVMIETFQGWGALQLDSGYVQALRRWTRDHGALLIFDEVQTGFGRTGLMWGHEHYGVEPDLLCIGKGITSSLPLAAVLGPAEVLDVFTPGEITTTHAGHPLSCAAAMANLRVIEEEKLVEYAGQMNDVLGPGLRNLQKEFPAYVERISGAGMLWAIHLREPGSGQASERLARQFVWEIVRQGVMVFHTNRSTIKVCPPLITPEAAIREGIQAIGDALAELVKWNELESPQPGEG